MTRAGLRGLAILVASMLVAGPASAGSIRPQTLAPAGGCGPSWSISAESSAPGSDLHDVQILSSTDAWAVGTGSTLPPGVEHWDGTTWTPVAAPGSGYFLGVNALSSNDIWAVGHGWDGFPLVEHYDGAAWAVVPSPAVVGDLSDAAGASPSDVWAVGTSSGQGLIEHWNGTEWSMVDGALSSSLAGVAVVSSNDVWAVGSTAAQALIEHWDGSAWTSALIPNGTGLADVDVLSATDAWAVGSDFLNGRTSDFIVHWDGSTWTEVPAPTQSLGERAVAAVATDDVWAVGSQGGGVTPTVVEHWDGRAWTIVPTPNATYVGPNDLLGIDAALDELWTVGVWVFDDEYPFNLREHLCPARVLDSGFRPADITADQGATVAWSFPASNVASHTVTDGTGARLFGSGTRPPGSSFTFNFFLAGTFGVLDRTTGYRSVVKIPIIAEPPTGGIATTFTVTWYTPSATSPQTPYPYAVDVQVKRPGSEVWEDWLVGVEGASASFLPDAGVGTYQFQSRVSNSNTGHSTGWSPPATVVVS